MGLTRITDATVEPVSLAQAKSQVFVASSITSHDQQLRELIRRARHQTERATRRAWLTQTWKLTLQRFPYSNEMGMDGYFRNRCIQLPRPPLASVTSVTYVDTDEATQTLATTEYNVRTNSSPGVVALAPSKTWPTTHTEDPEAVTITYVAGYTSVSDVPPEAIHAILALVDYWFRNRDKSDVPEYIHNMLSGLHCGMKMGAYGVTA